MASHFPKAKPWEQTIPPYILCFVPMVYYCTKHDHTYLYTWYSPMLCWHRHKMTFNPTRTVARGWSGDVTWLNTADVMVSIWEWVGRQSAGLPCNSVQWDFIIYSITVSRHWTLVQACGKCSVSKPTINYYTCSQAKNWWVWSPFVSGRAPSHRLSHWGPGRDRHCREHSGWTDHNGCVCVCVESIQDELTAMGVYISDVVGTTQSIYRQEILYIELYQWNKLYSTHTEYMTVKSNVSLPVATVGSGHVIGLTTLVSPLTMTHSLAWRVLSLRWTTNRSRGMNLDTSPPSVPLSNWTTPTLNAACWLSTAHVVSIRSNPELNNCELSHYIYTHYIAVHDVQILHCGP